MIGADGFRVHFFTLQAAGDYPRSATASMVSERRARSVMRDSWL
jgi:hypothetical protein